MRFGGLFPSWHRLLYDWIHVVPRLLKRILQSLRINVVDPSFDRESQDITPFYVNITCCDYGNALSLNTMDQELLFRVDPDIEEEEDDEYPYFLGAFKLTLRQIFKVTPILKIKRGAVAPRDSIDRWLMPKSCNNDLFRVHYGVDSDSPRDDVVWAIARILRERINLIDRIVGTIGVKRALEFCHLAEEIENSGGLCTVDGTRRRTPGGTFLFLVRHSEHVSDVEKTILFMGLSKLFKKRARGARRREVLLWM